MASRRVAVAVLLWLLVLKIGLLGHNLSRRRYDDALSRLSTIVLYYEKLSIEASAGSLTFHFHISVLSVFFPYLLSYVFGILSILYCIWLGWPRSHEIAFSFVALEWMVRKNSVAILALASMFQTLAVSDSNLWF
jgi:hypothetical protein